MGQKQKLHVKVGDQVKIISGFHKKVIWACVLHVKVHMFRKTSISVSCV